MRNLAEERKRIDEILRLALKSDAALADALSGHEPVSREIFDIGNCVADGAVGRERVSRRNSLVTGKLTGNFGNFGVSVQFGRP